MLDRILLIIGAMKCGTTSLFSYLAQHPQIAPSREKEPDFFTKSPDFLQHLEEYRALWKWREGVHRWAMEASTSYTKVPRFPCAAERIATMPGEFRFIYLMRNPISRIESHLRHLALTGLPQPDAGSPGGIGTSMLAVSRYAMQLDEYERRFPREHVLLLSFEELQANPREVLDRVCRFLDIDPAFELKGLGTAFNPSRIDHPVYRALTRIPFLPTAAKLVPVRYRQALRNLISRDPSAVAKLTSEQCAWILDQLKDDLKRLHEHYGFDVTSWGLG